MRHNNYANLAASVAPSSPQAAALVPSLPELSVAKKDDQMAAAKVALFAYNRRSREPIWQSGISESRSIVADRWYFGAGPFHKGNIYGTKQTDAAFFDAEESDSTKSEYFVERRFADPTKSLADGAAKPAVPAPATTAAAPAVVAAAPAAVPAAAGATAAATPVAAAATAHVATATVATVATAVPGTVMATAAPVVTAVPVAAPVVTAAPVVAVGPPAATQTVNCAPTGVVP